jgi:hypothetical protein
MSAADWKRCRSAAAPVRMKEPVRGICPKCGKIRAFVWIGGGLYRCGGRTCGKTLTRDEIREAPKKQAARCIQGLLFGEDGQ